MNLGKPIYSIQSISFQPERKRAYQALAAQWLGSGITWKGKYMTREEFLTAWTSMMGKPPNPEQLVIMDHGQGPLQITAGPGVGKTYALILRVLFLLFVCQVAPEAIVLTTFTHKAAGELRQRLQETISRLRATFPGLNAIDLSRMRLGTLHSLCWDILTETPGSSYRHLQPLGALERAFFVYTNSSFGKSEQGAFDEIDLQLARWIDQKFYTTIPPIWQRIKLFTTAYERVLNDQLDMARFANARPEYYRLIQLIEEYKAALGKRHFTDQTLLQQQALELLCSPEGIYWVQNIQHLIVDEYQDTNPLQAALYRALAAVSPHTICVVGDDDQALFRFRGATVGCLVHFAEECQRAWPTCEVRQLSLVENYRSQPAIVEWCNTYISVHPQMLLPYARVQVAGKAKAPLHAQPSPYTDIAAVVALRGKNIKESANTFAATLHLLKEQGVIESYTQCALIAYSIKGKAAQTYISVLQQLGIPVTGLSSHNEQLVYKQVLGTLFLALDRSKNLLPAGFPADNTTYVDECRQAAEAEPILGQMARQITTWLLTNEKAGASMSLGKLAQRILNAGPCIAAIEGDQSAEAAVQMLIQTLDAYDRIVEQGWRIPVEEVPGNPGKKRIKAWWMQRLYRVLVEGILSEHLERGEEPPPRKRSEGLTLLTIHKAKGLEFPIVAVVVEKQNQARAKAEHRLERDVYPFRQDLTAEQAASPELVLGGNEEDRAVQDLVRLHYVAYSRAQALLLLLTIDDHLKTEPPALGLGIDAEQFRQQIEVWPPKPQKTRKSKSGTSASQEGVVQHGFEW
jgi:DNA helicase-2/ATP-dependent DNA helicase PcrA